jgi:hypothetical protein
MSSIISEILMSFYESPPEYRACEAALPVEDPATRGSVADAKGGHLLVRKEITHFRKQVNRKKTHPSKKSISNSSPGENI